MKWGRKKPPSSSKPSFISHVSPLSCLSKFKQMRINSEHGKLKQNAKQKNDSSPKLACGNRGRFYGGGDDDAFWRLSFGEESTNEHKKSEDVLNAKRHGRKEGILNLKDIGLREERTKSAEELECLRRRYERKSLRVIQEKLLKLDNAAAAEAEFASSLEKDDELQFESPTTICTPRTHLFSSYVDAKSSNLGLGRIREAGLCSNTKQSEDLKAKVNKKRQSVYVSRELQRRKPNDSPKARVHSPRMPSKVEICKIKAIEDKKKAKLKMKKKEEIVEETEGLDSFAVVKCSLDPQQDFRDSMIEMIRERQISQPEDMEELLACYLTLNSIEYHDLIIKAFRQVWLYMSHTSLCSKSDKQCCLYD